MTSMQDADHQTAGNAGPCAAHWRSCSQLLLLLCVSLALTGSCCGCEHVQRCIQNALQGVQAPWWLLRLSVITALFTGSTCGIVEGTIHARAS
jgi:hypothetical protein